MLASDGQLGVMQAGELLGGEAAFRLQLEEPEIRGVRQVTRLIGQGSPSIGARGSASSGRKDSRWLAIETGELAALPANPAAAGNRQPRLYYPEAAAWHAP
jgi:hypothetical protein